MLSLATRSRALLQAGARVAEVNEPEWFRVLNASSRPVRVTTTLPEDIANPTGPTVTFDLDEGEFRDIRALADFQLRGDGPVLVGQFMGSQSTTGIPNTLPGGDPALLMVPPLNQWRTDYVFLTPNKYAFDFVQIVARPDVDIFLDETPVRDFADCTRVRSDGCIETPRNMCPPAQFVTYRCQSCLFRRLTTPATPSKSARGASPTAFTWCARSPRRGGSPRG